MIRQPLSRANQRRFKLAQMIGMIRAAQGQQRIGRLRHVALPDVYREPARRAEQVGIALDQAAVAAEAIFQVTVSGTSIAPQ